MLTDVPNWYVGVQADLKTAQGHASNWLNNICPAVSTANPQGIVDFNQTFQAASQQMINILVAIQNQTASHPTAAQRTAVNTQLQSLLQAASAQQTAITTIENQIKQYSADIKSDQDTLNNDLGVISQRFTDSHTWVTQVSTILQDNFLNTQTLGPCYPIVMIDFNVTLKVNNTGCDPSLIAIVFAQAILKNQINNSAAAQQAVQALLDSWAALVSKCQAVISDLQQADDDAYISIMEQIDLQTAQDQWQQLADYAQTLIPQ